MKETYFRAFWANFVIVTVLVVTFAVAMIAALPSDLQLQAVNNAIYQGDREGGKVALMFNVYEREDNALKIAEILSERGFNATFFVGGCWAERHPDALLKLASKGCEIGNHGYMHRDHAKLSFDDNVKEIKLASDIIDGILSVLPDYEDGKLFAPPSGSLGKAMFDACDRLGYRVIMWTRDTVDWRDHDADVIFERAVKDVRAGDFILMHPTDCTVAALPRILDKLSSLGIDAAPVSACLPSA